MLMKIVINFHLLLQLIDAIVIVEPTTTTTTNHNHKHVTNNNDNQFKLIPKMIDNFTTSTTANNHLSTPKRLVEKHHDNQVNTIVTVSNFTAKNNHTPDKNDDDGIEHFIHFNQYMGWISIIYMAIIALVYIVSRLDVIKEIFKGNFDQFRPLNLIVDEDSFEQQQREEQEQQLRSIDTLTSGSSIQQRRNRSSSNGSLRAVSSNDNNNNHQNNKDNKNNKNHHRRSSNRKNRFIGKMNVIPDGVTEFIQKITTNF
ncbi:uncharacterized protein LOC113796307 [Dermatophagoides pteronyssinus]|uniref:uncharacterized protein LOC113796307 n=1 Tax=Dermatophagoides pteronyssinus TaxID=6956 RepID=UPI003F673752